MAGPAVSLHKVPDGPDASSGPDAGGRPRLRPWESTLLRHLLVAVVVSLLLWALTGAVSDYHDVQLSYVSFYLVAVAGLTVLTGLNGQISLGHGALMAIGAYTTALLMLHQNLTLWEALFGAVVATAVAGALLGAAAARLRGPYLAGATLALAVGLPGLADRYSGALGGDTGLSVTVTPPSSLGATFTQPHYQAWIGLSAAVVTLLLLANLMRSRVGRTFRAVRDDEVAASLAGLHVARTQVLAFVVSSACAGLAGGLLAAAVGTVNPGSFTLQLSLALLTGIVLGGLGSLAGAVWGSLALILLPEWSGNLFSNTSKVGANLPLAIYGVVLIVVMLAFPAGIQGALRRLAAPALRPLQSRLLRRRDGAATATVG